MGIAPSSQGLRLPVVLLTFFLLISCASFQPGENEDNPTVRTRSPLVQELSEYKDIELLFQKNLKDSFHAKAEHFQRKFPNSSYLPAVANFQGLGALRDKELDKAISYFRHAIELNPTHKSFNQYVLYNLATAQFDAGQINDAQTTVNSIQADSMDKPNRVKVQYLKASIYSKKKLPTETARELLIASRWAPVIESFEQKKAFTDLLDQALQEIPSSDTLGSLLRDFEDSPTSDSLLYYLGSREIGSTTSETMASGINHLKTLMSRFPQSSYFLKASELVAGKEISTPMNPRTIGVLLPTKGKFGRFGLKTLQGIQLAFGTFNPESSSDSDFTLIVEDSGDEPEQAVKALERLVEKHHAAAIIGPIMSKGLDQVAQRAQELQVPLISLARRSVPAKDFVINGGLNQQIQTYEVVRYAIQKLGMKKFAAVYPNDKTGMEMAHSFWDAVESLGGKMTGFETYAPGETDFRHIVDKLAGLNFPEARQRELELLSQEREANNIKKKTRKTEQYFKLKPLADFDAVFIADEPKVAGQLIPTFAYRDIDHVKFLGNSSWNSNEFLSRIQSYGESAIFDDAFYLGSEIPKSKKFLENYKNTFKQDPTSMEALAFDAALVLKSILNRAGPTLSRNDLKIKLTELQSLSGVTGNLSYKEGTLFRDLRILTVRNGRISEI